MKKIIIIGGGLAGLVTAVKLAHAGIHSTLLEKKNYPFHRVCGEYISNEAKSFLQSLGIYPEKFSPPQITRLTLTSIEGKSATLPLDLGGFGISRYVFDNMVYQHAVECGVTVHQHTDVVTVTFDHEAFTVRTSAGNELRADVVIGAFGKRSRLDVNMDRAFTKKRSPFVGVKYHIRTDHPADLIALHNFEGGYCGISNIEDGKSNLCYLAQTDQLKKFKGIDQFQREVMYRNPHLKRIFESAEFLFESPETIGEISFETKSAVQNHVLMAGDSAGMITPLCGNGMAMAIHSAKLLSELLIQFCFDKNFTRAQLEAAYEETWRRHFANRLWKGRQVQRLFGHRWASAFAVSLASSSRTIANEIVRNTHGPVF